MIVRLREIALPKETELVGSYGIRGVARRMNKRLRATIITTIAIAVSLFYVANSVFQANPTACPDHYASEPGNVIVTLDRSVDLGVAKNLIKRVRAEYEIYRLNAYYYGYDDDRAISVIGVDTTCKPVVDQYRLSSGRLPHNRYEVAISSRVAERLHKKKGDYFVVPSFGRGFKKRIVGFINDRGLGEFDKRIALLTLGSAQTEYKQLGKINQINLKIADGDLNKAIKLLNKAFAEYGGIAQAFRSGTSSIDHGFAKTSIDLSQVLYGSLVLFSALILIDSIFVGNMQRSMRIYATYRILGARNRYIMKLILSEGLRLGSVGSVLGIVSGSLLLLLFDKLGRMVLTEAPFAGFSFSVPIALLSLLLGIFATVIGSLRAFRFAVKIKPIEVYRISDSYLEKKPGWFKVASWLILLALGLAGVGYYASDPAIASRSIFGGLGFILSLIALMKLTSTLLTGLLALASSLLATSSIILIINNIKQRLGKVGSVATIFMITSFIMFFSIGFVSSQISGSYALQKLSFPGDMVLTFQNVRADIDPYLINKIRGLQNVEEATSWQVVEIMNDRGVNGKPPKPLSRSLVTATLLGIDYAGFNALSPFKYVQGNDRQVGREFNGNKVVITQMVASAGGLKLGDRFMVPIEDGRKITLEVAGVVTNTPTKGFVIFANKSLIKREFGYPYDNAFAIKTNGHSPKGLDQILEYYPQLQKRTFADIWPRFHAEILSAYFIPVLSLNAGLILISMFGLFNLLNATIFERKREIGILRSIGLTRKKLRLLLHLEGLFVSFIGLTVGSAGGFIVTTTILKAIAYMVYREDGMTMPTGLPVWLWVLVFVVISLASQVSTYFPTKRLVNENIVNSIAYE